VGPSAGLDDVEERKLFTLLRLELRALGRPAHTSRYTDYATLALLKRSTKTNLTFILLLLMFWNEELDNEPRDMLEQVLQDASSVTRNV
jgi:hypothetical protein